MLPDAALQIFGFRSEVSDFSTGRRALKNANSECFTPAAARARDLFLWIFFLSK